MLKQVFAETHLITAGDDFSGETPAVPFNVEHGHAIAPASAKGGLFSLDICRETGLFVPGQMEARGFFRFLQGFRIVFGGQSAWTLNIVGRAGTVPFLKGTTDASLVATSAEYYLLLTPDEHLELKTTGASTAMSATFIFESWRKVD